MKRRMRGIWEYIFVALAFLVLAVSIVGVINIGDKLWYGGRKSALNRMFQPRQTIEIDLSTKNKNNFLLKYYTNVTKKVDILKKYCYNGNRVARNIYVTF